MSDTTNAMVSLTINGKEYKVEAGTSLIEACHNNGIDVPHYCYHKDLSVAGNCRMCLVKVEKIPKPAIACATIVAEGMVVDTQAPEIVKIRESVMEFLLVNHPLDCPVCDQAGECKLQDYSYTYGRSVGRFKEEKVVKHTKDFGSHVKYWGTRCIVCTRCVRFTDEISGTQELAVFNRGDHSEIDIFPGMGIENPLSMNVVDVCPVGALVSSDFLYQARVWFMEQKNSICLECSVGCNTRIDSLNNEIKRIVPRDNRDVNKSFMCDYGRLNFNYVHHKSRIESPMADGKPVSWKEGIDLFKKKIQDSIKKNKGKSLAFLVSAWNDNETLYLIQRLKEDFLNESDVFFFMKEREKDQIFPKFRISGDKNPNVQGIKTIFGTDSFDNKSVKTLLEKINHGLDTLVFLGGLPNGKVPKELIDYLDKINDTIVIDYSHSEITRKTTLVLPSLTYMEKSGSYINDQKRLQRVFPAIDPIGGGKADYIILQELMNALRGEGTVLSASGVFDQIRSFSAFKEVNYRSITDNGILIQ